MFIELLPYFFSKKKNEIESKGYLVEIGQSTSGRDDNSVSVTIMSPKKNIVIIVWELGFCHLDYLDWSKDEAWNEGLKFENEEEMTEKMEDIVDSFL